MICGMTNIVYYSEEFKKSLKPLAKKYLSIKETIKTLENDLIINPFLGESYGDGIYKIRISDKSKGKGKSGGFRILYYILKERSLRIEMVLITIFDKSERETYSKKSAKILRDIAIESVNLIKRKEDNSND
jgi:mRNA-degrading endonuclease RelE of RelBE toxin-antitoxin system